VGKREREGNTNSRKVGKGGSGKRESVKIRKSGESGETEKRKSGTAE
jgi:hypothetical protein